MKKVLSVAMASAMVLGMGANAFAIQYASGSSDTAAWPAGFQFDGKMFVTDKDGNIVTSSNTKLDGKTRINFNEGDTIWMPLYANNQKEYTVKGYQQGYDKVEATTVSFDPVLWDEFTAEDLIAVDADATVKPFEYRDNQNKVLYWYNRDVADTASYTGSHGLTAAEVKAGWRIVKIPNRVEDRYGKMVENVRVLLNGVDVTGKGGITEAVAGIEYDSADVKFSIRYDEAADMYRYSIVPPAGALRQHLNNPGDVANLDGTWMYEEGSNTAYGPVSVKYSITYEELNDAVPAVVKELAKLQPGTVVRNNVVTLTNVAPAVDTDDVLKSGVEVVANLPEVPAVSEDLGEIEENKWETSGNYVVNTVKYGHYTGNIDKNWSINLIEEDNGVAEMIEKAELYKADEVDYLSYKDHTTEIMPNAVYVRVHLKDTWKSCSTETLKYYVYVADNKSNNNVTNKVWVSGKYEASNVKTVDFTWTNDASKPAVWKVDKNENGTAVFDFADKAFFSVKMYAGECMYLDLSTAYDKIMAGDFDEAEQFFKFDNDNANFSRTGVLMLVSDDSSLSVYEVTEDGYVPVDAEYVTDYAIAHTNEKVDGFVFETKQLGNYVLAPDGVVVDEDEDEDDNTQEVVVPDTDEEKTETSKPNPSTGAEDFVGLAVSLAVVSVAAAGALALKK